MKLFFDVNQTLLENLLESYDINALALVSKLSQDKNSKKYAEKDTRSELSQDERLMKYAEKDTRSELSHFDRFNKRFKISWGMEIKFTDNLPITKEDTRACYILMLKISDLWFAFEHLVKTASKIIPKDVNPHTKVDFYREATLSELGFDTITSNFNELMYGNLLHKEVEEREINHIFSYLQNTTKGKTQEMIENTTVLIQQEKELQAKHIFSIADGIRNIYVHEGVAAALGSGNYQIKRIFYSIVYDTLVLYSLALGNSYCCKKLADFQVGLRQCNSEGS